MNYRVFRYLITGSIISLLLALASLLFLFLRGGTSKDTQNRELTMQLQQLVQQIANNQDKLISGSRQISKLLNIPAEQYSQLSPKARDIIANPRLAMAKGEGPNKDPNKGHDNNQSKSQAKNEDKGQGLASQAERIATEAERNAQVSNVDPLEIAFYDALHYLDERLQQEKAWEELNQLLETPSWKRLLKKQQLRMERSEEAVLLFSSQNWLLPANQVAPVWLELSALPAPDEKQSQDLRLKLEAAFGDQSYNGPIELDDALRGFITKQSQALYNLAAQYSKMYSFVTGQFVAKQLATKDLYVKGPQAAQTKEAVSTANRRVQDGMQTDWEVRTRDQQVVARLSFDIANYQLIWNDKIYQSQQLLRSDWDIFIDNVDTRTAGQRQEDQMREHLQKMLREPAFLLQMEQYSLKPAALPPREDKYYEYYDLLNDRGERMASFALQKRVGEAYLMDRDDVKIRGLKSFLTGVRSLQQLLGPLNQNHLGNKESTEYDKAVSNSAYYPGSPYQPAQKAGFMGQTGQIAPTAQSDHNIEVILLVGTHDSMADVIMLLSINHETEALTMISVPRDLYYKQTKINAVYSMYGPGPFMTVLSEIAGIPITKYISIDMYAFIEVVDLIGGVDVYLQQDLIDPTYKVKQMGRLQTLVMRKGQHHLDGLGALRYARSRHTSNDFERSARQQLILNQVAEKLNRQLSNPKKLLPFLQVMQKYLKTNLGTAEIAQYWLSCGSYRRSFGNTISTDNVLYYTWANYLGLSPAELQEAQDDEDFYRGAFILLPQHNDWSLIREYIMRLQEG